MRDRKQIGGIVRRTWCCIARRTVEVRHAQRKKKETEEDKPPVSHVYNIKMCALLFLLLFFCFTDKIQVHLHHLHSADEVVKNAVDVTGKDEIGTRSGTVVSFYAVTALGKDSLCHLSYSQHIGVKFIFSVKKVFERYEGMVFPILDEIDVEVELVAIKSGEDNAHEVVVVVVNEGLNGDDVGVFVFALCSLYDLVAEEVNDVLHVEIDVGIVMADEWTEVGFVMDFHIDIE